MKENAIKSIVDILLAKTGRREIDKGFIPFADWSDCGILCFHTTCKQEKNNYTIILWDHEVPDEVQNKYEVHFDLLAITDDEERIRQQEI